MYFASRHATWSTSSYSVIFCSIFYIKYSPIDTIWNISLRLSASPLIQGSCSPGNILTWRSTSQRTAMQTSLPMTIPGLFLHLWKVRNKCRFNTGKSYKRVPDFTECYTDNILFSLFVWLILSHRYSWQWLHQWELHRWLQKAECLYCHTGTPTRDTEWLLEDGVGAKDLYHCDDDPSRRKVKGSCPPFSKTHQTWHAAPDRQKQWYK